MTTAARPTTRPRWATSGLISAPSSGAQDSGHIALTALAAQLVNWFWNLVYQWVAYFDDACQPALNALLHPSAELTFAADDLWTATIQPNTGRIVAAGENDTVKTSDDGGVTWTNRTASGSGSGHRTVLWDPTNSWFVLLGGAIFTSPDGVTWTNQLTIGGGEAVLDAVLVSPTRIVAIVSDGDVITSIDGGLNWSTTTAINGGTWFNNKFVGDGSKLVTVGRPVQINPPDRTKAGYWSNDNGATWNAIDMTALIGTTEYLVSIALATNGDLVAFTSAGQILRSVNGGAAWTLAANISASFTSGRLTQYAPILVLLNTTGGGTAYASRDYGATWYKFQFHGYPTNIEKVLYLRFAASHMWLVAGAGAGKYAIASWAEF